MRTHGWGGNPPASDEEAIDRIVAAARRHIDERGSAMRIADIARELGVTRQTVYRYFPSTEALLHHAAIEEIGPYLDAFAEHLRGVHDPAEAVVEGIAHALESLPNERYLGLLIPSGRPGANTAHVTSEEAFLFGRSLIERLDVDWPKAGFSEDRLNGLVEFMLRIAQSFIIDPGRPPRVGHELRKFLYQWVAPAVSTPAAPSKRERSA